MKKTPKNQNLSSIAIRNSSYSFISVLMIRFGGLFTTILLIRLLSPELFGIYSLAFSIIAIVLIFTDLGVSRSFLRYFSDSFKEKNSKKSRSYFKYFLKIKLLLIFSSIILLMILSRYISHSFYKMPLLFWPLIVSSFFIFSEALREFFDIVAVAKKDLAKITILDSIHQFLRFAFILVVLLFISHSLNIVSWIFIALGLAGFIRLLFIFWINYRDSKGFLFGNHVAIDTKRIWKYLRFMSFASVSLVVFGSLDILMLGKFVDPEYISYYRAALSLVIAITSCLAISNVLLPIFTQIGEKRFERGVRKTLRYLIILTLPATVGLFFTAKYLIFAIYGSAYSTSLISLYFLIPLILSAPITALYTIILESKEKSKILAKGIIISLFLNIILNYSLIKILLGLGQEYIIEGVAIATTISRWFLLVFLVVSVRRNLNLKVNYGDLIKPLAATIVLGLFLYLFNLIVIDMTITWGIIEVISGIIVYLSMLSLLGGFGKEDINLIKSLIRSKKVNK
jgi:O-antigen/teichoic acid export membrane protein